MKALSTKIADVLARVAKMPKTLYKTENHHEIKFHGCAFEVLFTDEFEINSNTHPKYSNSTEATKMLINPSVCTPGIDHFLVALNLIMTVRLCVKFL